VSDTNILLQDHPRLRGEHTSHIIIRVLVTGSPPPTRGALAAFMIIVACVGITPAYAGSTASERLNVMLRSDHPRLRGEHLGHYDLWHKHMGSPPPTRGAQS